METLPLLTKDCKCRLTDRTHSLSSSILWHRPYLWGSFRGYMEFTPVEERLAVESINPAWLDRFDVSIQRGKVPWPQTENTFLKICRNKTICTSKTKYWKFRWLSKLLKDLYQFKILTQEHSQFMVVGPGNFIKFKWNSLYIEFYYIHFVI